MSPRWVVLFAVALQSIGCSGGTGSGAAQTVSIQVDPAAAELLPGGTLSLSATVNGLADQSVTWSVDAQGGGTVDPDGRYTAPNTEGTYTVSATAVVAPSDRAQATVKVTTAATAAPPRLSPGSTRALGTLSVTIACPTVGTLAYGTTDGSAPSASSGHVATVTLSATTTLRAICAGAGYAPSAESSAVYTIGAGTDGWVTPSGAACVNGSSSVPDASACEWKACKDDPLPSAVFYVCNTGGDDSRTAAQAQNPGTPWASFSKAFSYFPTLQGGQAIAFCRGGTFTSANSSGTVGNNTHGTRASPVVVRDYTRPGREGMGDPRPIINGVFGRPHYSAMKFENLAFHVAGASSDVFFLFTDTSGQTLSDVSWCNLEIANSGTNGGVGIHTETGCNAISGDGDPACVQRLSVIGNRISGFGGDAILMGGKYLTVTDNYLVNNGDSTVFNHAIYMHGNSKDQAAWINGPLTLSRNEIHMPPGAGGVAVSVHGIYDQVVLEDNTVVADGAAAAGAWGIAAGGSGYAPYYDYISNFTVRGNTVINAGNLGIGIATCKTNCLVENNLVINTTQISTGIAAPMEASLNNDPHDNGVTVRNNTVYLTKNAGHSEPGIYVGKDAAAASGSYVVVNNVVQSSGPCYAWGNQGLFAKRDYDACSGGTDSPIGSHSWTADPRWVSPGADFRPAAGSPLTGAGDPTQRPTTDLSGKVRSVVPAIGAFEP